MITVCVPTRQRQHKFRRMAHSARTTAAGAVEIVARLDDDDPSYPDMPETKVIRGPRPLVDGLVQMSGLWTEAWNAGSGDVAMLCGDDVVFETPGWDERVEDAFDEFPDRIGLVYCNTVTDPRPVLPFVSREWTDVAGFVPDDLQGWFSDEWLWHIAAELGRVIFLEDVVIRHEQGSLGMDQTYLDAIHARERAGGLDSMREAFYTVRQVARRDALVAKLRRPGPTLLTGAPWEELSLRLAAEAREHDRKQREETLVVVHCYAGDRDLVKNFMPVYKHHGAPVLVLSPEDSPVKIRGVDCHSVGGRGYFGQVSLDRQRAHLEYLLTLPYNYFLLNDADSFCVSPELPRYLYPKALEGYVFSNEVTEWRPHPSPYPKIGMHPPYFLSRVSIARMLSVADRPEVKAHPITPYIDWYMVALTEESGTPHLPYTNGASFPAWGHGGIAETQELGHDARHSHDTKAPYRGDLLMVEAVKLGAVMLHSVKHKVVMEALLEAHEDYVRRGSPRPNTMTIEEYSEGLGTVQVQEGVLGWGNDESVRI